MKKMLITLLVMCILSGCSFFRIHKLDIEQGNIITQEQVQRLHTGMTEAQVQSMLGQPILVNLFSPNRLDYVYSFQAQHGEIKIKRLTCLFRYGRLVEIKQG